MSETAVGRGGRTPTADLLAGKIPLIPVLHIENVEPAEPILFALEEAGIAAIEVTLRTAAAIKVIERMKRLATTAKIGAGTITWPEQFERDRDAGYDEPCSVQFGGCVWRRCGNGRCVPGVLCSVIVADHGANHEQLRSA